MPPRVLSLVLLPAVLSWLVTAARVVGEVNGFGAPWVSSAPGGGGALLGIVWLAPVFGAWFGWRLAPAAPPRAAGLAVLLHLAGLVAYVGGFQVVRFVLRFDTTTPTGLTAQILAMGVVSLLVLPLAFVAWPQLARTNVVYAFAVRVPTAVVTFPAVFGAWGTHLEKFGPNDYAGFGPWPHAALLAFTQLVFWTSFTVLAGGLFGSLVALARRRRAAG